MNPHRFDLQTLTALWESDNDRKHELYLDLETGKSFALSKKVLAAVDEDDVNVINHLQPQLQAQVTLAADVIANDPSRFALIPRLSPTDDLNMRKAFIATVTEPELRNALTASLMGRGAFRHFSEALVDHPAVWESWTRFRADALKERVAEWIDGLVPQSVGEASP